MKPSLHLPLLALVASLAACASHGSDSDSDSNKLDYQSQRKNDAPKLDAPPDITQMFHDNSYSRAGGDITANHYQTDAAADSPAAPTAVSETGGVRMEHAGSQRWLVVEHPTAQLWERLHEFWQENGFLLTVDRRDSGIMETDWAEHQAKLPQDIVRATAGKLVDSVYATDVLDRYRTRLEQTANGATEIYVSHRGMVEVRNSAAPDQPDWQTTPTDAELETEFLRRLMVRLGQSPSTPPTPMAMNALGGPAEASSRTARLSTLDGQPVMQLNVDFDRAWRRIGLALDRTGFTVEDRDRNTGLYFVRYVPPNPDRKEPGIFTKMLDFAKSTPTVKPLQFRIAVKGQGNASSVSVLNAAGVPDATENARRIIKVIADDVG